MDLHRVLVSKKNLSGQVPVIEITGAKATKIGKGTTRIPEFTIKKWIDRPAELASQNHSPSAPQPAEAPAPAAAEVDEF